MIGNRIRGTYLLAAVLLLSLLIPALPGAAEADDGTPETALEAQDAYAVRFVIPKADGTADVIERLADGAQDGRLGVMPEAPFFPGMTFVGWADAETGQEITADTLVCRDLTAEARFEAVPVYTVTIRYCWRRSAEELVYFDQAILYVNGEGITEAQPLTVTSPVCTQADEAAMLYHEAADSVFYPEEAALQITRADLEASPDRQIFKTVEYTPAGIRPAEAAGGEDYIVHYVDGKTGEALLPDQGGVFGPDGTAATVRAAAVTGYLPDAWEKTVDPEDGEREITFRYAPKGQANSCTVQYVLLSDPTVHVADSQTLTVEGDARVVTVTAADVSKAAMAASGASQEQLRGLYYPVEVCIQHALGAAPDNNTVVFYYARYEETAIAVRYADMLGEELPDAEPQTVYARKGETALLATEMAGYVFDHAEMDGQDLGTRAYVTAAGQEKADVTLYMKIPAVIAAADRQKVYDGTAQTYLGLEDVKSAAGLRRGDTLTQIGFEGARQAVGVSEILPCGARIVNAEGRDVTANYALTYVGGVMEVTEYAEPITVTVTGGEFIYDGGAHGAAVTVGNLPAGYALAEARSDARVTHVGDGAVTARADVLTILNAQGEDVTSRLNLVWTEDSIQITPALLTAVTLSASKVYDGAPLTAEGRLEGLQNGETASLTVTGSQTDAGESVNTCVLLFADQAGADEALTALSGDYAVQEQLGTLRVSPLEEVTVQIIGHSGRAAYDGEEHTVAGYDVRISNSLYTEADFVFQGADSVSGVDADVYEQALNPEDFVNINGNFANVVFAVERGELVIDAIPVIVTVTGHTGETAYSGGEQSVIGYDVAVSTALFTEADFVFDGEAAARGTDVGEYAMGLNQDQFHYENGNFLAAFDVTDGRLTIVPCPVVLRAASETFVYDGETHFCGGYAAEGLAAGDQISAVVTGEITFPEEGPAVSRVESWAFVSGDPKNYAVTTAEGELVMLRADAAITLTAASQTWTYDGMSHQNPQVSLTAGELFPGDEVSAVAVGSVKDAADTAPGNNPLSPDVRVLHDGRDVTDNYRITAESGTLTVEPLAVTAVITGNHHRDVYDGEEHAAVGFAKQADSTLYNPESIVLKAGESARAARRDAGESYMGLTPDRFENLDGNFSVTFVIAQDGWQIVEPKAVTVQIAGYTDTVPYDGQEHIVTGYSATTADWLYHVSQTALRAGEKARAARAEVGATAMNLTADQFENQNGNFSVTYEIIRDGAMVVTPAPVTVTVTEHSGTAKYDGTEHAVTGYEVRIDNSLYTQADFIFTGEAGVGGVHAGVYGMALKPEDFENINGRFDPVTFVIEDGGLTVEPRQVILTSGDAEKAYDGEALTENSVFVSGDGFAEGEGADWLATGSQTLVGESENAFTFTLWENTLPEDYAITSAYGRLAVTGNGMMAEVAPPAGDAFYGMGEQIPFVITVKNVTDAVMTGVRIRDVIDDLVESDVWRLDEGEAVLADIPAGGQAVLQALHTVTSAEIRRGVCVYTVPIVWQAVNLTPAAETDRILGPDLTLTVDVQLIGAPRNGAVYTADETIVYAVTVTNGGTVPYTNVTVTNEEIGLRQTVALLAVDQSVTLTAAYTVTAEDARRGAAPILAIAQADPVPCGDRLLTPAGAGEAQAPAAWPYTLTIQYCYLNGMDAAAPYTDLLLSGEAYDVPSPEVPGFRASLLQVQGFMPERDMTYTVYYIPAGL